jgi:hydroxymethylpyrimidine/phosphomethylpyrimidine kinase
MQTVLTIAGFDPSSGAGVTADLMVFAAHSLFGTACITALTVQSTLGVRSTHPTPRRPPRHARLPGAGSAPAGIKIGMLATEDNVFVICDYLEKHQQEHWHLSEGWRPCRPRSRPAFHLRQGTARSGRRRRSCATVCFPRSTGSPRTWPSLPFSPASTSQAATICPAPAAPCRPAPQEPGRSSPGNLRHGRPSRPARRLPPAAHRPGTLAAGQRVVTRSTHGTGCALSSAFLSRLVLGDAPRQAAQAAKLYVATALQSAVQIGTGHGPINHLWPISKP